jgi:hypothetical protein
MPTPQNADPTQYIQNNPNEGFNQPIDTTNL